MKNSIQITGLFLLLLIVPFACKEDFITLTNPSSLSEASYYKTDVDLKGALTAAYSSLQSVYDYWYQFAEVPSDNSTSPNDGAFEHQIDLFELPGNHSGVSRIWTNLYRSIAISNLVIDHAEAVSMDATLKARYVAEAKFIRSLDYFNLVRCFGDIPLVLNVIENPDDALAYRRDAVAKVYTQIINDLTELEKNLPAKYTGTDIGRVTSIAAKTLLGEVYMTQKNYSLAVTKLKEAITLAESNGIVLLTKYDDIFAATNGNNAEIIFSIQYQKSRTPKEGSKWGNTFIPQETGNSVVKAGRAYGYNLIHEDLENAFEPDDSRKTISVGKYISTNGLVTLRYTKKYLDPNIVADSDGDNDWPVYRYADLLLLYAEALNETGKSPEALTHLNKIRNRAGLTNKVISDASVLRLAIEQERRIELNMEGHRWFDLIRTGRASQVMNSYFNTYAIKNSANSIVQIGSNNLLFPIPETERTVNPNLTQNEGY